MTDYTPISGKKNPPKSWGESFYIELRNGMRPSEPWPVRSTKSGQTRWLWGSEPDDFDIVAVKKTG